MGAELRGDQIGAAARSDLQFSVPTRPAVRLGVRLRPKDGAVFIDGSDRAQMLTGGFVPAGLAEVVGRCDGTRTHSEIAEGSGLGEGLVYKCLALLWSAGAIEEAPGAPCRGVPPELAVLLSRLGNSTGCNAAWTDAVGRLDGFPVALVGDPELSEAVTDALSDTCRIVPVDGAEAALVVLLETPSTHLFDTRGPHAVGGRLLRVRADARRLLIGPYVDARSTPCLDCGRRADDPFEGAVPPELRDLYAGLVGHHVVSMIARTGTTHLPLDVCVIDAVGLTTSHRPVVTVPGCPRCSFSRGPRAETAPAGAVYEASVALPPRDFLSPRDHQAHYFVGNQGLQQQFRTWPSRSRLRLPPVDTSLLARTDETPRRAGSAVDELALVLGTAFGVDDARSTADRVKRWTASGGNIGGNTAYLLVHDGSVLPRGTYAYCAADHSLVRLSDDAPPGERAFGLVVTGDLRKTMAKYGTFGFRLAFLDAGCSLATMRLVCRGLGLPFRPSTSWSDHDLAGAVGVDPAEEPIVAVAGIGGLRAR